MTSMIETDIQQQLNNNEGITATISIGSIPANPTADLYIGSAAGVLTALENSALTSQNVMIQKSVNLPNVPDSRQTISIVAINSNYTTAHDLIWNVYNHLIGQTSGYKICNGRQMYFVPIQSPYLYKTDSNNKNYFILNVNVNAT